jgi:hypothetical protein
MAGTILKWLFVGVSCIFPKFATNTSCWVNVVSQLAANEAVQTGRGVTRDNVVKVSQRLNRSVFVCEELGCSTFVNCGVSPLLSFVAVLQSLIVADLRIVSISEFSASISSMLHDFRYFLVLSHNSNIVFGKTGRS